MRQSQLVEVRPLTSPEEVTAAVRLYREAFGYVGGDPGIAPTLFAALRHHGGSAVGAFDVDTGAMVGFTYGFVGLDDGLPYHHSQAAVVDPSRQGQGVGRLLKYAQRQAAAASGVDVMRWVYNPLLARNAHFNLDVLGGVGRWFHRDYYAAAGQTYADRVGVEWPVNHNPQPPRGVAPPPLTGWGEIAHDGPRAWVAVPGDWIGLAQADQAAADKVYKQATHHLEQLLIGGYVVVSCRLVGPDTAFYRAERAPA